MAESTTDDVRRRIEDFLAYELGAALGYQLDGLEFDGDDDDDDAFLWVVKDRDGRRFEIEFDVTVVELTDELLARRAAFVAKAQVRDAG